MRYVSIIAAVPLLLLIPATAAAQDRPIQWESNPNMAVERAQRTQRPLLFYVEGEDEFDESDLQDAQEAVLRNRTVRRVIQQRFVPAKLYDNTTGRQTLADLGVPVRYGMILVVATPDGDLIGTIPPRTIAARRSLLRELTKAFHQYRQSHFEEDLKPLLTDDDASQRDTLAALERVGEFLITSADKTVIELLERERLAEGIKRRAYRVLALLSTEKSIETLAQAAKDEPLAARALRDVTPVGARRLLDHLENDDDEVREVIYEAIAQACELEDVKPVVFYRRADPPQRKEALSDFEDEVRRVAKRWEREFGPLR